MHGADWGARVRLADAGAPICAVGAPSELRGGFTIFDSTAVCSYSDGDGGVRTTVDDFSEGAELPRLVLHVVDGAKLKAGASHDEHRA